MMTNRRAFGTGPAGRWWYAVLVGLVGLGGVAYAETKVHPRDIAWMHPQLDQLRPMEVAVLPAVAFVDDPVALRLVEVYGSLLLAETGHVGQPASRVRQAMAGVGQRPDALYEAMARQVRATGAVDGGMARTLARLAEAPALMTLRIDRWEIVDARAQVELTAALVDSTGRVLWRICGLAGDGATVPSRILTADAPLTALVGGHADHPGSEIAFYPNGSHPHIERIAAANRLDPARAGDLERALRSLMNRWVTAMPSGYGDPDSPGLAVANARLPKRQAENH